MICGKYLVELSLADIVVRFVIMFLSIYCVINFKGDEAWPHETASNCDCHSRRTAAGMCKTTDTQFKLWDVLWKWDPKMQHWWSANGFISNCDFIVKWMNGWAAIVALRDFSLVKVKHVVWSVAHSDWFSLQWHVNEVTAANRQDVMSSTFSLSIDQTINLDHKSINVWNLKM